LSKDSKLVELLKKKMGYIKDNIICGECINSATPSYYAFAFTQSGYDSLHRDCQEVNLFCKLNPAKQFEVKRTASCRFAATR